MNSPLPTRTAFTLIELILALALSAVLLALLGAALNLGIARATNSRGEVEQARLVEGVLTLVTNDIASGAIYDPQDTSTEMGIAEATAKFDVDSIDSISSGDSDSSSDSDGGASSGASSGNASADTATAASLRRPLGVYGTLEELQIDVLREHPQFAIADNGAVTAAASTGGITTVRYALGTGAASLGLAATLDGQTAGAGLVRQEAGRDVLNWATQTGNTEAVGRLLLVAPEVSRLEFRYFDGLQVVEEWDTQQRKGAQPRAIELRLWFAEPDAPSASPTEILPYVVTVALPSAWNPIESDPLAGSTDDSTSTSTGSSTSGAESGGGGGR